MGKICSKNKKKNNDTLVIVDPNLLKPIERDIQGEENVRIIKIIFIDYTLAPWMSEPNFEKRENEW